MDIIKEKIIEGMTEGLQAAVSNLLKWIGRGVINSSYWICLTCCLLALVLYIAGQRKAGKYVSISFVIYFILQSLKGVIK